jgi:hypothetical protein
MGAPGPSLLGTGERKNSTYLNLGAPGASLLGTRESKNLPYLKLGAPEPVLSEVEGSRF